MISFRYLKYLKEIFYFIDKVINLSRYLRTFAEIDVDAIENNLNELKNCIPENTLKCAVVKADAYGHGAVTIAELLSDKVDFFAVASADEAMELRREGIKNNILILSYTHSDDYEELISNDVRLTIYNKNRANKVNEVAKKLGKIAKVHIAIDTGMTRIGFYPDDEAVREVCEINKLENIELEGIFSHYACADMTAKSVSDKQTELFKDFVKKCNDEGVSFSIKHMCNSAGISEFNEHFDLVRMGISLYGLYPSDEIDQTKINLIPALTFKSHIISIKDVDEGTGISYGHTYVANEKRRIATVSAGYADGYPRALSGCGRVIVNGKYAPIVGRVCMDMFMIDVTDIDCAITDEVILFGSDGNLTVSAEEIGEKSMSFNYEVICGVSRRIPRVYKKDGKTIKTVNYLR